MRVEVYYNLHRKCLSVRALEGPNTGTVIRHVDSVALKNVKFVVQPAGRAKVLKEKRKNVHAFVRGELIGSTIGYIRPERPQQRLATYNPYRYTSFVDKQTEQPVTEASLVIINGREVWYQ